MYKEFWDNSFYQVCDQTKDLDNLIVLYKKRLNLQNAVFSRIDHEDAMVATVYKITQTKKAPLILKICSRSKDYLHETYFLKYFADQLPVPRIMEVVQPESQLPGAILMECLPGSILKGEDYTDSIAYKMGSLLACIHLNRLAGYGDVTQPHDLNQDPRVHFTLKFEESLDECGNHLPKTLIDRCRLYYDKNQILLNSVDGPCIIHRDFRAGNLLIHEGKIQGIIDWSSARASFAEDDFCSLEHGEYPFDPAIQKSFLLGYASIRPVPTYQTIMPFLRLNRAIAVIGFTVKRGTWDNIHARIYQFNRRFLEVFVNNFNEEDIRHI